jgi:ubiquitin-activating enzyme E1
MITGFTDYTRGGVVSQVKMPKTLNFKSFVESIKDPTYIIADWSKMEHSETLNVAFQALDTFQELNKRAPRPWNSEDHNNLLNICVKIAEEMKCTLNNKLLKIFSYICSGQVCPMNGFVGGVVAQEVMKCVSGKFHPLFQWMFFDAIECLPFVFHEDGSVISSITKGVVEEAEFQGSGSRYDGQIAVFGKRFQEALGDQSWFVVGAGAIGWFFNLIY